MGSELPAGLADMSPGPDLSALLATVDRAGLSAAQLAVLAAARARQVAHDQAGLLADAVALAAIPWDGPGPVTRDQADDFAADQVAFALTMSRWAAYRLLDLGEQLLQKLPMVYEALAAGRIDYPRAAVYVDQLCMLDEEVARAIATATLAKATVWTPSQLKDRLRYRVHRADPTLAKQRHTRSVADRRFCVDLDTEGTARLSGVNLPPDRAAAADNWIDRLARAAKADGDSRTLQQLRADAMLDLLAGVSFELHPSTDPLTAAADAANSNSSESATSDTANADAANSKAEGTEPTDTEPADSDPQDFDWSDLELADVEPPDVEPPDFEPPDVEPPDYEPASTGAGGGGVGARLCTCGGVRPAARRGVVDIQVKLSTLLDLDEDSGWIPGWGPVIADIARQVAFDEQARPAWAWSVTDESGQLLHHGYTARRAPAAERAFVKARDRTCRAPGCRRPAIRCDTDHRVDYVAGGPSHRGNGCSLCRHHHRLKHEKGFTIHGFGPAAFMWEAPDGRLYLVPGDGNILLVEKDPSPDGWDLDDAPPPQQVRQIIPA
jgi:Domain of unknown function (DUF222)